jgi:acyl carrier protein
LPAPDGWRSELDTAFIVPSTPIEEIIATIWKEVLGIQRVGIYDNFFDLGGHSLLATQVVTRMRRVFQSEIPLRDLFEFPTIAELAATISGSEDNQTPNPKEMEHLLVEIEAMSDDEAEKLLAVDGVRS